MRTKLIKSITSYSLFACALVSMVAAMAQGTSATGDGGIRRARLQQHAEGLVYLDLRRVRKHRWEPGTESRYARHPVQRRWYVCNEFGTVNIGGTIIIDVTGPGGTYTVAADCTGTLSIPNGPSFNMFVGPGAQKLWITQTAGGLGTGTATREP